MDMQQALRGCGVNGETLTVREKQQLDEQGYLPLLGLMSHEVLETMRAAVTRLVSEEGSTAGAEVHQEAGTHRLADLVNKDPVFDICYTQPKVLGAVAHVIRQSFKLSSINSRSALPGEGLQHLHADYEQPVPPGEYAVCNTIWLLDDFTRENGATRLVPGSHCSGKLPQDVMPDPGKPHPDEIVFEAPAGSVLVINAHVWHGGTKNMTQQKRRACHSYFCRRDQDQQTDQRKFLRPETNNRISNAARYILDVL